MRLPWTLDASGGRTTTSYDAGGHRTLKQLPNGTRSSSVFDAAGQLVELSHLKSDESVIGRYEYDYDGAGNVTLTTEAGGDTIAWSYDALDRLTGDVRTGSDAYDKQFVYDPVGNRLVEDVGGALTTSTFDAANQLSSATASGGTTLYTFDASGNQQLVQAPGGALTTSVWDYENQNIQVLLPSGDSVDMAFHAANRRVTKTSASGDKVFLWSGVTDNIIQDMSPAGTVLVANTFLPGNYGELIKQDDGQANFFLFDRRGSTMAITNEAQVIADTFRFDGYGNLVARTGSSLAPYQFQGAWGYYLDAELGSVYIRRRSYLPLIGRWLSMDPLGLVDGNNHFVSYFIPSKSDPTGFQIAEPSSGNVDFPSSPEECSHKYCVYGKTVRIVSCEITEVTCVNCSPFTKWIEPLVAGQACGILRNKLDEFNTNFPGGWYRNDCGEDCECSPFDRLPWQDQTVILHEILFKEEYRGVAFIVRVTGSIEFTGSLMVVPCRRKETTGPMTPEVTDCIDTPSNTTASDHRYRPPTDHFDPRPWGYGPKF